MSKSKLLQKIRNDETAVRHGEYNPHLHVLRSPSPSLNFIFGNGHGLPFGYSAVLSGPPKGGKSIIANAFISQLQKDDPEALVIKWNTEYREEAQMSDIWEIDHNRYQCLERSSPEGIFDFIENDIAAACQDGEKWRLIVIDSVQGIQGRMAQNSESVVDMRPGDHAMTIQNGLSRILPVIRKYKIAVIWTNHIRANFDMNYGHGPKTKMAGGFAFKHGVEYFIEVNPRTDADGRKDWMGGALESTEMSDVVGEPDKTGKRIFVKMAASSMGGEGRKGEFLLDFHRGIIDPWGEIAAVGAATKAVFNPPSKTGSGVNNRIWQFGDETWNGWENFLLAVKDSPELQQKIIQAAIAKDLRGNISNVKKKD